MSTVAHLWQGTLGQQQWSCSTFFSSEISIRQRLSITTSTHTRGGWENAERTTAMLQTATTKFIPPRQVTVPVLVSGTRKKGGVLNDDVGALIYPVWHIDAFEMEVVDDPRTRSIPMVLISFTIMVIGFRFHVYLMGADPLGEGFDVPREDLLDQILKLVCWSVERLLLLKQINGFQKVSQK